ncbi:hypothetical protein NHJ13051_009095 [Beauveria bassiana]
MKASTMFCLGLAGLVTAAPTAVETQGGAYTDLAFSPAFWAIIVFANYDDEDLRKRDSTTSTAVVYTRAKDGKVTKRGLADADAVLAQTYLAVAASEKL